MPVQLDHTIVAGRDAEASARWFAEMFGIDPPQHRPGQINHRDGGRGVYFLNPDGHFLEILTRPYGSGG